MSSDTSRPYQAPLQLTEWTVYDIDRGTRHFVGRGTRRMFHVSETITHFNADTRIGVDQTGQAYELSGPNGGLESTPGAWEGGIHCHAVRVFTEVTAQYRRYPVPAPLIVFLVLDGVLRAKSHRPFNEGYATRALQTGLDENPGAMQLVITGPHGYDSLAGLCASLPPGIAAHIIGETPLLTIERTADRAGSRYREILLYLDEHPASQWIVLDDDETLFPPACPNLVLCENGFDLFTWMELQSRLHCALLADAR